MDKKDFDVFTLNPSEIVKWCKERKETLGYSNKKISEITNVPIGTIDRILAGKYTEFKYSSIQPILSLLIGYEDKTPKPNSKDDSQGKYYYDTIEGYKLIVENKNKQIERLEKELETTLNAKEYLKKEVAQMEDHMKWMETLISKKTK